MNEADWNFETTKSFNHVFCKCFGDIFESVAAAILIDGGWKAFMNSYG